MRCRVARLLVQVERVFEEDFEILRGAADVVFFGDHFACIFPNVGTQLGVVDEPGDGVGH